MSFHNRTEAGQRLAERLAERSLDRPIILGLPRGGVPVAFEVARRLDAPLDVLLVRKIGAPGNPEFGIGAVGEDDVVLLDDETVSRLGLSEPVLEDAIDDEREELHRRLRRYRGGRAGMSVTGRTCVLVDDGLATGVSAAAAVRVLRARDAGRIIVAVPVGAPDSVSRLEELADEVLCLHAPPSFVAVGSWYEDFSQTTDDEVVRLLEEAASELREEVHEQIPVGDVTLPADLTVPPAALGLVVFAHGSGSGRESPRNRRVARVLNDAGLATLLFDLLTPHEGQVRDNVFDIDLLAQRLLAAARWAQRREPLAGLPIVLFGSSTGAAAALVAAAESPTTTAAVISRGGRPDLASTRLPEVHAPTLFIVGERDTDVLELNRDAAEDVGGEQEVVVVPGAGHLFEEAGALDIVAEHAARWAVRHTTGSDARVQVPREVERG